jgi:DNA-binding MarR family transcriptional regulator
LKFQSLEFQLNGTSVNTPHLVHFDSGTAPVRRAPTPLARRFSQMCMGMQADGLAAAGLTSLEYGVLATLNREDGEPGIDQNSLALRVGVDRSHVSLLVEGMAAKDLVEQRVNGADRRARQLFLTRKAERLYARVRPGIRAANARVLEPLTRQERDLFIDMLIRMIRANGAYARPGAGRRKRVSKPEPPAHLRPAETSLERGGRIS